MNDTSKMQKIIRLPSFLQISKIFKWNFYFTTRQWDFTTENFMKSIKNDRNTQPNISLLF